ncbi:MAG: hypothetical protein U5K69_21555 [Balneolaceae bacterium]|nr:hypothetical protein [Balneolaceae bacterium]
MGQQQLLLVILVTIIVGIATVVAINTFSTAADSANLDAVRQDVASIAASAQGYFMKPGMLGGGGQSFAGITFENITFGAKGVTATGDAAQNENGRYVITSANATTLVITAHPASDPAYVAGTVTDAGVLSGGTAAGEPLTANVVSNDMNWGDAPAEPE